jgi:hypothetical protein
MASNLKSSSFTRRIGVNEAVIEPDIIGA